MGCWTLKAPELYTLGNHRFLASWAKLVHPAVPINNRGPILMLQYFHLQTEAVVPLPPLLCVDHVHCKQTHRCPFQDRGHGYYVEGQGRIGYWQGWFIIIPIPLQQQRWSAIARSFADTVDDCCVVCH